MNIYDVDGNQKVIRDNPCITTVEDESTGKYRVLVTTDDGTEGLDGIPDKMSILGEYDSVSAGSLISSFILSNFDNESDGIISVPDNDDMEQILSLLTVTEAEESGEG